MSDVSIESLKAIVEAKDDPLKAIGDIKELAKKLDSNLETGLNTTQVAKNREKFGPNRIPEPPVKTLMEFIIEGLQDKTLIMLMCAACVSLILGIIENPSTGWIEGTAILFAVVIVVMVSSLNDYSKEQQFRKLNSKKNNKTVKTIRNGESEQVSVYDIVVGDIVNIEVGDILCADGLFLEGFDMKCDEGAMTGEADAVKKDVDHPILYSGCLVLEGCGKMLVIATGVNSQSGSIMMSLQTEAEATPLQEKLSVLSDKIAKLGMFSAGFIFVCLLIKLVFHVLSGAQPLDLSLAYTLTKYIISSITVIVVAVPEGLPLAVTIALAYSMGKMLRDNNLVRHLDACETMGGATAICSDKTGTLTQNKMTIVKTFFANEVVDVEREQDNFKKLYKKSFIDTLTTNMSINSSAYQSHDANGKAVMIGNRTDCAIVDFCTKLDCDYAKVREDFPKDGMIPFSSQRKRMSTVVTLNNNKILMTKGASEIILSLCTKQMDQDGNVKPLTDGDRKLINDTISSFANATLRTISIAQKPFSGDIANLSDDDEKDLIFLGMVGIKDPIRPEVPTAVGNCLAAGIRVRMVTGDNITTATAIAKECGIVTSDKDKIIEGPRFREMTDEERVKLVPDLRVMARSSPNDKLILVNTLKKLGHVVAVTGDGTNDAPALKSANVGFAMGIAGTEVSKEASDIILMDDNFTSIVKAVSWGRNVFDSIRKFLQFQLTVNIVAVALAFFGAIFNEHGESLLTPVQMLWVNLIMDTMAALALATDDPKPELLKRKPYGKNAGLITPFMWRNIIVQGIFQLCLNIFMMFLGADFFGVKKGSVEMTTVTFNVFVFCQVFNEINCRKLKDEINVFAGIFDNILFVGIMAFTFIVQFLIVTFGGDFTTTRPLTLNQWLLCLGIASIGLIISVISKLAMPLEAYVAKKEEEEAEANKAKEIAAALEALKKEKAQVSWAKLKKSVVKTEVKSPVPKMATIVDMIRRRKVDHIYGFETKEQSLKLD